MQSKTNISPHPLVAVFIATYHKDHPAWLEQALDSILGQTYPVDRVHIYLGIDGPLPGGLEAVISARASRLHRVVRSDVGAGLAATLNRLLAELESEEYVLRMDADDISRPQRIAQQVSFLQVNTAVGILGSHIQEIDALGQPLGVRTYPRLEAVKEAIARGCPLAHPTVCFRAAVLQSLGGYPISGTNEDIALWFAALDQCVGIDNLPEVLLDFRLTAGTFKRRGIEKSLGEFKTYWSGIQRLHGVNWRLIFPVIRLLFRLMPRQLIEVGYRFRGARNRIMRGG